MLPALQPDKKRLMNFAFISHWEDRLISNQIAALPIILGDLKTCNAKILRMPAENALWYLFLHQKEPLTLFSSLPG